MIVRVMTEGQYELTGAQLDALNHADEGLLASVQDSDAPGFRNHLAAALDTVRAGRRLDATDLRESELVLPAPDMTVHEARRLFEEHQIL